MGRTNKGGKRRRSPSQGRNSQKVHRSRPLYEENTENASVMDQQDEVIIPAEDQLTTQDNNNENQGLEEDMDTVTEVTFAENQDMVTMSVNAEEEAFLNDNDNSDGEDDCTENSQNSQGSNSSKISRNNNA